MSEIMQKMSDMIKNNEIPDNIKSILNNFSSNSGSSSTNSNNFSHTNSVGSFDNNAENSGNSNSNGADNFNIDMDTMLKMKSIIDNMNKGQNDSRANLLRSLKPYLKPSRKEKVDQYIKIFSMGKAFEMMGTFGGEKKNGV